MLTLDQVGYKKNDSVILEHVSLSLQKKEIVTLIGPNGSGKTTLIKIMMGLLIPTSGKRRVSKNIRLGYMPQSIHLDPYLPLTVRHFLSLVGVCDPKIIDTLQLTRLLSSSMQTLSGGEKQRVLLAQAIIKTPHLLILDEPTQGVDIHGQAQFFDLILHLRDQLNCSIFMVSHDLHTVFSKTDHVICLNRHICCQGKPHEVGSFLSNTYGIPSTQSFFAGYQHHHDHSHDIS